MQEQELAGQRVPLHTWLVVVHERVVVVEEVLEAGAALTGVELERGPLHTSWPNFADVEDGTENLLQP